MTPLTHGGHDVEEALRHLGVDARQQVLVLLQTAELAEEVVVEHRDVLAQRRVERQQPLRHVLQLTHHALVAEVVREVVRPLAVGARQVKVSLREGVNVVIVYDKVKVSKRL